MNFSLVTEYPSWFILFCLLAGLLYSFLLYRKERLLNDLSKFVQRLLIVFRFLSVTILCFLLLSPMFRSVNREVEKPIIILAQDNSQSIVATKDSVIRKKELANTLDKLVASLRSKYELRTYSFGDEVKTGLLNDFTDKQTDFSLLYDQLNAQFLNRNVGAIIIASDGIYNSGNSPVGGPSKIKAPVYTIALGDTNEYRDVMLSAVNHNKTAFLGNSFPLEIVLDARQSQGSKVAVTIKEDSTVLAKRDVIISGNRFHTSLPVFIDAKSKGVKHYTIEVTPVIGEQSLTNNLRDVYVEVIESKQKVLLLAHAPHPDLAAIKSAVETNQNYEITLRYAKDIDGKLNNFNLVILHQLPSVAFPISEQLQQWKVDEQSLWFVVGAATNINALNSLNTGLTITNSNAQLNEVQASLVNDFSLFVVSEELKQVIPSWPPLKTPFGLYKLSTNAYNLLYQRIGVVATNQPLMLFNLQDNLKTGVTCGEGLWRWRLADNKKNGNQLQFNELVNRIVQYLSVTQNKSPFRLQIKSNYKENEAIIADAELYNASGELVNNPEVKMSITGKGGKQFTFTFTRTDNAYTLNAGLLPVGYYRFKAETKLGDNIYTQSGEFSVSALQMELTNTVANHQLLFTTSSLSGGLMTYPGQEEQLLNEISKREDITSVSYLHKKLKDLVDSPWVFALIILLLGVEWMLRKRSGSY